MRESLWIKLSYLALAVQVVGVYLAIILYREYPLDENLSSLGARQSAYSLITGNFIPPSPYPEIFNITIVITGLVMLRIPLNFFKYFGDGSNSLRIITIIQLFAYINLILLGIFDVGSFYLLHLITTLTFFYVVMIAFLLKAIWMISRSLMGLGLVRILIFSIAVELSLSILRQFSINQLFTDLFYFENGIYQKLWGIIFVVINLVELRLVQLRIDPSGI